MAARNSFESLGLCEIPLKVPKPGTDFGRAVQQLMQGDANAQRIIAAASELQQRRDRLAAIETLSDMTVDEALSEMLAYDRQLEDLQGRLEGGGAELGQLFRWRDAWKPRLKCEQKDLDFERACVRFNIAAAQCYLGRCARERGTQARGLSQARDHFQQAAAYLDNVHATVKAAIWGLRPRWAASSLTPELSLDVLAALRELMLAQAQRVVYEKAISEGLSDSSTAKLASGASAMYAGALKALEKPEVREHLNEEGGLFSKGDKSWLGRAESQQHAMAALAEEHSSREHAANFAYGEQVARLQRAVAAAAAAERVAAATLHASSPERKAVAESHARLQAVAQHAAHENANIYLESVPPPASLAAIEAKRLVQPTPAPPPAAPRVAAFEGLLPATLGARIAQHHTQVHDRLLALSTDASRAAAEAEAELRRLSLPEVLDACSADKRLPQRLVDKVEQVRAAGGLAALRALRGKCDALEADAAAAAGTADALLASEDESDAALMREYHDFDPEKLATGGNASSGLLGACRARLAQCRTRLRTAADVTKGLVNRLTTGLPSLEAIEAPLEELQASLPHLDGTPLEAEPCVPALRKLLDDLDGLKADGAASLAAAHQAEQRQRGEAVQLGEGLLVHHLAGTLEEAMAELLASSGLEQLERDAKERSARRAELLRRLAEQARVFETARSDAHSYEARQAYLAKLSRGAEEALELQSGLKEGAAFYESVLHELTAVAEQASRISDRRERERAAFKRAVAARAAAPPPPPPPSATTGGRAQVAAATAFMAPSYPGAAPSYPTATPYAPQYHPAQAQPQPQPVVGLRQQPQPQSAPPKIGCCNCRRVFAVPAGSKIVACPYCGTHNRVPV